MSQVHMIIQGKIPPDLGVGADVSRFQLTDFDPGCFEDWLLGCHTYLSHNKYAISFHIDAEDCQLS